MTAMIHLIYSMAMNVNNIHNLGGCCSAYLNDSLCKGHVMCLIIPVNHLFLSYNSCLSALYPSVC